jgi:hypothetical protein
LIFLSFSCFFLVSFLFCPDLVLIFYHSLNLFFLSILSLDILFHCLSNFGYHSFNYFFHPFFYNFIFRLSPSLFFFISFYTRFGPHCFDCYLFYFLFLIVKNFVQDLFLIFCMVILVS